VHDSDSEQEDSEPLYNSRISKETILPISRSSAFTAEPGKESWPKYFYEPLPIQTVFLKSTSLNTHVITIDIGRDNY
jgi:hypothetical protein